MASSSWQQAVHRARADRRTTHTGSLAGTIEGHLWCSETTGASESQMVGGKETPVCGMCPPSKPNLHPTTAYTHTGTHHMLTTWKAWHSSEAAATPRNRWRRVKESPRKRQQLITAKASLAGGVHWDSPTGRGGVVLAQQGTLFCSDTAGYTQSRCPRGQGRPQARQASSQQTHPQHRAHAPHMNHPRTSHIPHGTRLCSDTTVCIPGSGA